MLASDSATPWAVAHQSPLSMEFYKQQYWGGFPFPPPGDLPNPGIKLMSQTLQPDSLPLSHKEAHAMVLWVLKRHRKWNGAELHAFTTNTGHAD